MLSPASPPGPALGPALREGLKLGPGPSPTFKARAWPELVFLGPDPSLSGLHLYPIFFSFKNKQLLVVMGQACKIQALTSLGQA